MALSHFVRSSPHPAQPQLKLAMMSSIPKSDTVTSLPQKDFVGLAKARKISSDEKALHKTLFAPQMMMMGRIIVVIMVARLVALSPKSREKRNYLVL